MPWFASRRLVTRLHELQVAYDSIDTDEAGILRILVGMSQADRDRMMREQPPVLHDILYGGWLAPREQALYAQVIRTGRLDTDAALSVAMGGYGDSTDETMILDTLGAMPEAERRTYRLGYWLHHEGALAEGEEQRAALVRFRELRAHLREELDDEELDAAMERLIGQPSLEDFMTPEGRRMALEIMRHRHSERLELSAGLTSVVSSTDDTAEQASIVFEAHLDQLLARGGDISAPGNLSPAEAESIQRAFLDAYRAASSAARGSSGSFDVALRFYQVNFATIRLKFEMLEMIQGRAAFDPATCRALERLLQHLRHP